MNEQIRKAQDCRDEMCACRGGFAASCHDGEREKEVADLRESLAFYKRRVDALQQAQSKMRDPERMMVCDILANGFLLVPAGNRYDAPAPAPAAPVARAGWVLVPVEPTPEMLFALQGGVPRLIPAYVGAQEKADALRLQRYRAMIAAAPAAPVAQPLSEPVNARMAALLEDWVTSFVDSIEGGEADELVAATRDVLAQSANGTGQKGGV